MNLKNLHSTLLIINYIYVQYLVKQTTIIALKAAKTVSLLKKVNMSTPMALEDPI